MKVAVKFTLAFLATLAIGLALYGWEIIRRETQGAFVDAHEKHVDIARTLTPALMFQWQTRGEESARESIERADEALVEVHIKLVGGEDKPEVPGVNIDALPAEPLASPSLREPCDGHDCIFTYVRLTGPNGEARALEIKERRHHEKELVKEAIFEQLIALGGLGIAAATASILLGLVIVGRPIERLSEQARRIGGGDLSSRLHLRGNDEIVLLAREMDAMVDDLVTARKQAKDEAEARGQAEEQLRHGERLMTVGALASGMAHELGTPLNVVQMRAKMIAAGEVEGVEAKESGRIIAEQAARITAIMRQLLDFARRRSPQKSSVDLRDVVDRVVAFLAPVAKKAKTEIVVRGGPLALMADGAQMQQVLTNIVMNGVQAMEGGGTLEIELSMKDGRACVEVKDHGAGIAPDHKARIFEPFFTTKEVGRGTGLGLSVAYGIVTEHGGFIEVESELGKGSTFRVHLPMEKTS